MNKRDKTMLTSLMKRGMLQSPLLDPGELSIISNQSLDPNVINAESISDTSVVQADEDPNSPLGKKCPSGMSKEQCKKQKKAARGECNAFSKKCPKSKRVWTKKPKNNKSKSTTHIKEKNNKSKSSGNGGNGGGNGGNGGNGNGGNGGSGNKGINPKNNLNINTIKSSVDDMYQGWT